MYTATASVTSGGHFTAYENLHLVEISRSYDRSYSHDATNAFHPSIFRSLCRMTIALPHIWRKRSECFVFTSWILR